MGLIESPKCLHQCAVWWVSGCAYTYAFWSSEGLTQPLPASTEGAAVNVGAGSVLIDPVGVYAGKREICVPLNEGPIVGGGNTWAAVWLGVIFPAPDWYQKNDEYAIVAKIKTYASRGRRRVNSIKNLRWAKYRGTVTYGLARIYNRSGTRVARELSSSNEVGTNLEESTLGPSQAGNATLDWRISQGQSSFRSSMSKKRNSAVRP